MDTQQSLDAAIAAESEIWNAVRREMGRILVGQEALTERLLIGLLADGHILLEGLPGLAKTLAVETLAAAIGGIQRRIQFTPDLLPNDITGSHIYDPKTGAWSLREGPVFGNIILADEINRAPAKVQSALLEAMQERSVSIGGETRKLPSPFLVLATQNPLEQEGTYPLPEAQLDRFLAKVIVSYPTRDVEREVLERFGATATRPRASQVGSLKSVESARPLIDRIAVDPRIKEYILDLVFATRSPEEFGAKTLSPLILHGASPRASLGLLRAARAHAFLEARSYVIPHDVKSLAPDLLRHRVIPSFEAEAEGLGQNDLVLRLIEAVRVP